jgi:hypothetical protein
VRYDETHYQERVHLIEAETEERGDRLAEPYTREEVKENITKRKEQKAMGADSIPNEFIKHAGRHTRVRLTEVFNIVREAEYTPPSWRDAKMTMLPKGGDKELLDNYRGITVNSNVGKLFTRILTRRMEQDVEERGLLGKIQHGFRKGWRSTDAAFTLTHIINKYQREKGKLAIAFLDLKKAYDRISRVELWKTLNAIGYGGKLLRIIQGMYEDLQAIIQLGEITTEKVKMQEGLKQGCSMSPILFALYVAELGDRLIRSNHGAKIGQEIIPALFFADDMVILAESQEELQRLLDIVSKYGEEKRMTFNEKKSQVLKNWKTEEKLRWKIGKAVIQEDTQREVVIEEFEEYKYLGLIIQMGDNIFKAHLEKLERKMNQQARRTTATAMKSASRTIIGKELWNMEALPSILHGAEITIFPRRVIEALEKTQNGVARKILRASSQVAVEALQGELAWWPVKHRIAKLQLCYYGRLHRLEEDKWSKIAFREQQHKQGYIWMTNIKRQAEEYQINLEEQEGSLEAWKGRVRTKIQTKMVEEWKRGLQEKSSLSIYRHREVFKYDDYARGDKASELLFKARTGDLEVNAKIHRWTPGLEKFCEVCKKNEEETVQHMIAECIGYNEEREQAMLEITELWGKKYTDSWEQLEQDGQVAAVLGIPNGAEEEQWKIVKRMLYKMWQKRSERRGVGIQIEQMEHSEDDWENVIQR